MGTKKIFLVLDYFDILTSILLLTNKIPHVYIMWNSLSMDLLSVDVCKRGISGENLIQTEHSLKKIPRQIIGINRCCG